MRHLAERPQSLRRELRRYLSPRHLLRRPLPVGHLQKTLHLAMMVRRKTLKLASAAVQPWREDGLGQKIWSQEKRKQSRPPKILKFIGKGGFIENRGNQQRRAWGRGGACDKMVLGEMENQFHDAAVLRSCVSVILHVLRFCKIPAFCLLCCKLSRFVNFAILNLCDFVISIYNKLIKL